MTVVKYVLLFLRFHGMIEIELRSCADEVYKIRGL